MTTRKSKDGLPRRRHGNEIPSDRRPPSDAAPPRPSPAEKAVANFRVGHEAQAAAIDSSAVASSMASASMARRARKAGSPQPPGPARGPGNAVSD